MNISTTELKQHINLLSKVKQEDILVTKRAKPFAVVVDYERYLKLVKNDADRKKEEKLNILNSLQPLKLGGKSYKEIKSEKKI